MPDRSTEEGSHLTGPLFEAVHAERVFEDSKRFADAIPVDDPDVIDRRFEAKQDRAEFDLRTFVESNFAIPEDIGLDATAEESGSIAAHIQELWENLRRPQEAQNGYDTLISLPEPHIVPGGRFREAYYWDSYFIAEGFAAVDQFDVVREMVENFRFLIDRYGYIPNGNRRYYLGRSQLPLFSKMLELISEGCNEVDIRDYLPALDAEYRFWMDGNGPEAPADSIGNRVVPAGNTVLNRYWDDRAAPRTEAFHEDRQLAASVPKADRLTLYRDIRAACESGWDFSSRWFADPNELQSIHTTDLLPIDLNGSLWYMERRLGRWYDAIGEQETATTFRDAARKRRQAITRYCWDDTAGYFFDYDWQRGVRTGRWTLAGMTPLFFGLATQAQAQAVADKLETRFLEPGGLVTTLTQSDQQWDAPNGWAPLQWMAVRGLRQYGFVDLADMVKSRWLSMTRTVFESRGQLIEKYVVTDPSRKAVGGEYPAQLGFGWTNAVVLALEAEPRIGRIDHGLDEISSEDDSVHV